MASLPVVIRTPYVISSFNFIGIYAIITLGFVLLMGYAGQISFGQATFYAIGAYSSGILTTHYGLNPWLCILVGILLAAAFAFIIGKPILKLTGHTLAICTFAINIIIYVLLVELDKITGGTSGLGGIPLLSIGGLEFNSDISMFYLIWIIAIGFLVLSLNLVESRIGRALRSMHHIFGGSEEAASMLGVDVAGYKVKLFILSAVFGAIAGSLYAHYVTYLDPVPFDWSFSLLVLMMGIVGGVGNPWGAYLGAGIFVGLKEILRSFMPLTASGPTGVWETISFGIILLLILRYSPGGLIQAPKGFFVMMKGAIPVHSARHSGDEYEM